MVLISLERYRQVVSSTLVLRTIYSVFFLYTGTSVTISIHDHDANCTVVQPLVHTVKKLKSYMS